MADNNNLIDFNTSPETVKFVEVKKPEQTKSTTITRNGNYTITPDTPEYTLSDVKVAVDVALKVQEKTVKAPINSDIVVAADSNYDGLKKVSINGVMLGTADIVPETTEQEINPGYGYDGFTSVTVQPVTSDIDENIKPENIAEGVEILGVVGTHTGGQESDYDEIYDALEDLNAGDVKVPGVFRIYDGSVDVQGLREIGWDDEDIQALKDNVWWYSWENDKYKVPESDKHMDQSGFTNMYQFSVALAEGGYRFCPKITNPTLINRLQNSSFDFQDNTTIEFFPRFPEGTYFLSNVFNGCTNLKFVPSTTINQNVFSLNGMFGSCSSLIYAPLLKGTLPNLTDCSGIYLGCKSLTTVPKFDTSSCTSMSQLFGGCSNLNSVPNFDTSSAQSFSYMFNGCSNLVNVPTLNTSNGTDFGGLFNGCSVLSSVPQIDTSNGTEFGYMFYGCRTLTTIPTLNTSNGTEFGYMFYGCTSLERIEGIDFSGATSNIANNTFPSSNTKITSLTLNGSINMSADFSYLRALDFDSYKSILEAASRTTNSNSKTLKFYNRTISDQGGQLAGLVADCQSKGWTITGLTLN